MTGIALMLPHFVLYSMIVPYLALTGLAFG